MVANREVALGVGEELLERGGNIPHHKLIGRPTVVPDSVTAKITGHDDVIDLKPLRRVPSFSKPI